jgi:hypothetical protein
VTDCGHVYCYYCTGESKEFRITHEGGGDREEAVETVRSVCGRYCGYSVCDGLRACVLLLLPENELHDRSKLQLRRVRRA